MFQNEYNPGSRDVDTQQVQSVYGPAALPAVGAAFFTMADLSQAVSYNLLVQPHVPVLGSTNQTLEFVIVWYAPDQQTIVNFKTFEVGAYQSQNGNDIATLITDLALGAFVSVYFTATNIAPSQGAITQVTMTLTASSRPLANGRSRIVEMPVLLPPITANTGASDGFLAHTGNISLGAAASTGTIYIPPSSADLMLALNGTNSSFRIRGGFGAGAIPAVANATSAQFTLVTPTFAGSNNPSVEYGPWPSPNRPAFFVITNIGSVTGLVSIDAWENG